MRTLILVLSFFIDVHVHADMIFLDLNDAKEEIKNCEAGLQENNAKLGRNDQMFKIPGVIRKDQNGKPIEMPDGRTPTYHALRNRVTQILCQPPSYPGEKITGKNCRPTGRTIDSIVISGEDGNGHFFGVNGDFQQSELRDLTEEFKPLGKSLKSAALWGCYTTSLHGAEQYWLNQLPNMQFTMGFTLQGPEKSREANHFLLKQFCERRNEAVEATGKDQLCGFYQSLKHLTPTSVGLCNRQGIVSSAYRDKRGQECFTPQELYNRCGEFVKNEALQKTYADFLSGKRTPDPNDKGEKGGLRDYYNKLNLWRHCREKFHDERGYDMPHPPEVIRLIKYSMIRDNLDDLNRKELSDYDRQLERAGLGHLALGSLKNKDMSRADLNRRIQDAIVALDGNSIEVTPKPLNRPMPRMQIGSSGSLDDEIEAPAPIDRSPAKVRVAKNPALKRMAECLRMTLVNMDWRCTQFKNINVRMGEPSKCIMSYSKAQQPEDDDDAC